MLNEKWQKKIMAALRQIEKKKYIYIYMHFFLNVKSFFFFWELATNWCDGLPRSLSFVFLFLTIDFFFFFSLS